MFAPPDHVRAAIMMRILWMQQQRLRQIGPAAYMFNFPPEARRVSSMQMTIATAVSIRVRDHFLPVAELGMAARGPIRRKGIVWVSERYYRSVGQAFGY
jgi:hypothetical protein